MAGLKWNTGKLYYSTVQLGYQQCEHERGNTSKGPREPKEVPVLLIGQ